MPEPDLLFVNIETAELDTGPFPIEIGWCDAEGRGEGHLLWPVPGWETGIFSSPVLRAITREELEVMGKPASEVAPRVVAALGRGRVLALSRSAPQDQVWLDCLLAAGGVAGKVHLEPLAEIILGATTARVLQKGIPSWPWLDTLREVARAVEQAVSAQATHRALAGAQRNAAIWRDRMHRIDEAVRVRQKPNTSEPESEFEGTTDGEAMGATDETN